jgi:hypothetical protein
MSDESLAARDSNDEGKTTSPNIVWILWPETWIYAALSGLDIVLTYRLLARLDHVEANPLARYFIEGWGLKGMVWFKLVMTAFVLTLLHALLQKKEVYARTVVRLGMAAVGAVNCYSIWLLMRA